MKCYLPARKFSSVWTCWTTCRTFWKMWNIIYKLTNNIEITYISHEDHMKSYTNHTKSYAIKSSSANAPWALGPGHMGPHAPARSPGSCEPMVPGPRVNDDLITHNCYVICIWCVFDFYLTISCLLYDVACVFQTS